MIRARSRSLGSRSASMRHAKEIGLTRKISNEFLVHHVSVDISPRWMFEGSGQRPDNLHPKILPKFHRRIRCHDAIKLHGAEPEPARFLQRMFAHRATDPLPACGFRDNKASPGNMVAAAGMIGVHGVTTGDVLIDFSNVNMRRFLEPISER